MTHPLTRQERLIIGQHQRKHMRRADHAGWTPKHRTESPIKLLQHSVRGRLPSLVTLKNQRMAETPFAYFRGAVPVMAYDLSLGPNSGIHNQLCGDAHVSNLGAFEGPDGRLVFDVNDFDETIVGPFEWDVKRMATSLILAGRGAGAKNGHCQEAVAVFLEDYRRSMLHFSRMPVLEMARHQVHRISDVAALSEIFSMAQRATPIHNLLALTEPAPDPEQPQKHSAAKPRQPKDVELSTSISDQPRIFNTIEPVLTRITGAAAQRIIDSLTSYANSLLPERRRFLAQYRPIDVAFKVVGTGSVGLRDYVIYMQGNGPKDPLFIQIKEEVLSAYTPYLGKAGKHFNHQGRRVVEGERAMQLQSDPFLGWTNIEGRDYLVRQLNDHKAAIDIAQLKASGLLEYAGVCGELLARGHARAGDCVMLAGYIGTSPRFDEAIAKFAEAYANQTEIDWKHFVHSTSTKTSKTGKPRKSKS